LKHEEKSWFLYSSGAGFIVSMGVQKALSNKVVTRVFEGNFLKLEVNLTNSIDYTKCSLTMLDDF
jgi:hypothetical protein